MTPRLLNRLIALLLVPCLVIQPGMASAYINNHIFVGQLHRETDITPRFSEEALALAMEASRNAREGHAYQTRQALGRVLLAPADEVSSTFAQSLSEKMQPVDSKGRKRSWVVRIQATILWAAFLPQIITHESAHVIASLRMILGGQVRINHRGILQGRPFRGPVGNEEQWPNFPWYEKWAGVVANLLVGSVSVFFAHYLPQPWMGILFLYGGVGNIAFASTEWIVEWSLGRGELYSHLRFQYDDRYPFLLSVEDGQKQMRASVDAYLKATAPPNKSTDSPMVLMLRLDPTFREIAEMRMGEHLSGLLRGRIYAFLVHELRKRMPGTLVAATEDENQLLVILPPEFGDAETVQAQVKNTIEKLYTQTWLTRRYHLADIPELDQLRSQVENKSAVAWDQIVELLEEHGIYISNYAGGLALIQEPESNGDQLFGIPLLSLPKPEKVISDAVNGVNKKLARLMVEQKLKIEYAAGEQKYPSFPITVSAAATAVRKADELIAWPEIGGRLNSLRENTPVRLNMARAWIEENIVNGHALVGGRPNPYRRDLILANLERILQSLMTASSDQLNVLAMHGKILSKDDVEAFWTESIFHEAETRRENVRTSVPLLDATLGDQTQPLRYVAPEDHVLQERAQMEAGIKLKDFEVRLAADVGADVERMRADANKDVDIYTESMTQPSRTTDKYLSARHEDQQAWFEAHIDPSLDPSGTLIHVHANPVAPAGSPTYGRADGNGMAVLQSMRSFMNDFVQKRRLPPGGYNLYQEMGSGMFATLFGGGQATRNPLSTQRGKFNLLMMMKRSFHHDDGLVQPAKLEEGLSVMKAVLERTFPVEYKGRPQGGYMLLYGDAIISIDPQTLTEFFSRPDVPAGFTLLLRRVPFEEAMDWGCAAVNPSTGRILKFAEKPGKTILTVDEQKILRAWLNAGSPDDSTDDMTSETRAVREKLHTELFRQGLLVDDEHILMNTAIGVAGTGTVIRFLQMAGVEIDEQGNFKVKEQGKAPMLPGDPDGTLSRTQELLASVMDLSVADGRKAVLDYLESLKSEINRQGDPSGNRNFAEDILDKIDFRANKDHLLAALRQAITILGHRLSAMDGLLRDGQQLDAMADLIKKMATEAVRGDEIFNKAIEYLTSTAPDVSGDREKGRRHLFDQARELLVRLHDSLNVEKPDYEAAADVLQLEMAKLRPKVTGTLVKGDQPLTDSQSIGLAYAPIYHAYGIALWNLRIWQILHTSGGTPGAGALNGAVFDGAWLDTGSTKNVVDYFLRKSQLGKMISAIFRFVPMLFSMMLTPGHAISSLNSEAENRVHPHALLVGTHLGGSHPQAGVREMDEGSAMFFSHVPWPFHLYLQSVVVEGVVYGQSNKPFVTHALWQGETEPGKEELYFGESISVWLKDVGIPVNSFWPPEIRKRSLFTAKLFPGISVELMEKAREGVPPEKLEKEYKVDALDWKLFKSMGEIWKWLQHEANAPPEAWLEAEKAGRLFSMSDQYEKGDPRHYSLRQQKTADALIAALRAHRIPPMVPAVKPGYWITGVQPPAASEQTNQVPENAPQPAHESSHPLPHQMESAA